MNLNFYLQGEVVPATYDFDMNLEGILRPSKAPPTRNQGRVLVLLANGGNGPTQAQFETIAELKTVNPEWEQNFFFQRGVAPESKGTIQKSAR